ncbi:uncharacterized protein LOC115090526 isoform X2 [Rhinatrema bivittatum]|nr:uncharacterized protein LOC115090526 isoform X2 [Rhinatrema bivittatum]
MQNVSLNEVTQEEEEEEDDVSVQQNNANNHGKFYQWSIQDGEEQLTINNDFVLEAHYTQPGARGIYLNTSKYGEIFLDFDNMNISGTNLILLRQIFLPYGQKEEYGWYYFDDRRWCEYGFLNSVNLKASMNSNEIEHQYEQGHRSFQFMVGQTSYTTDFNTMTQTNNITFMQRPIRRRPKFQSTSQNQTASATFNRINLGNPIWEYGGRQQWYQFDQTTIPCEAHYQQNPQGSMTFFLGKTQHILDFAAMTQSNLTTGMVRKIRRIEL